MNPDEQNTAAPAPPAGIQAIDAYLERTEEQRRELKLDQARAQRTIEQTMGAIAELEQRTEELLEARRTLQRAQDQPTTIAWDVHEQAVENAYALGKAHGAAPEPTDVQPTRRIFPTDGDGYRREAVDEAMYAAWGIIANAGQGDWSREGAAWVGAARRWRDRYGFGPGPACDHAGIGLPGCPTCDPRTTDEGGPRTPPADG